MPLPKMSLIHLLLLLPLLSLGAQPKNSDVRVLYLNSYDFRMDWTEDILQGIEEVLEPDKRDITLYSEAMDTKEFPTKDHFIFFRDYLEKKYRNYNLSLILCSDNNAFDFLRLYQEELFPGVPVVFCGVNSFSHALLKDHDNFTGISEIPSVLDTVELMLKLHPETKEIYVINDYMNSGRAWNEQIKSDLFLLTDRVKPVFSENIPLSELLKKVASLPEGTLILHGVYYSDSNGLTSSYEEMAEQIALSAKVPIYTLVDFNIQDGVVGGKVISGKIHGEAIARIGLRILGGESASRIPIVSDELNRFIFNFPELERFGIKEKDLPPDSFIINKTYTFYEEYHWEFWAIVTILTTLSLALIVSIFNIKKRSQAESTLRELADATWEGIIIHDQGKAIQINKMFSQIFGYSAEEIIGKEFIDKVMSRETAQIVKDKISAQDFTPYEGTALTKEGRIIPIELRIRRILYKGQPVRVAAIRDLSGQKQAEKEYVYLQSLWDRMFEDSLEAIFIYSYGENRVMERVNKSFCHISGYTRDEIIGKSYKALLSEYLTEELLHEISLSLQSKMNWTGEIRGRRKSGELFTLWMSLSLFNDPTLSGESKIIGLCHDISDKKRQEEELEWMSRYDSLTGFSNRTFFLEILGTELKSAERNGEICAVLMLNIDGLKHINNTYGFISGDKIIEEFSKRLHNALRTEDIVSRFGGDEFAVLAPRFDERVQIVPMVKRIREAVSRPLNLGQQSLDLSVSIGLSLFPIDGREEKELIAKAETALRRTKTQKRGSYTLFNSDLDKAVMVHSELEMQLKQALVLDELDVFYQPKVDPFDNRIKGFEGLIRWHKNHEEWISPGLFIPLAEENGLINDFGYFVINKTCDFIEELEKRGFESFHVGVNISARQFSDPYFIGNLINMVESKGISPSRLDLEVTESITVSKIYDVIDSLSRLSQQGFTISIDDFGTGYSSLQYLLSLPFDTLKIDKSFIDAILEGEEKCTVLDTMISLAQSLDKQIVAEGVETKEQNDYLKGQNCRLLIQGYYYSKPLPMEEAIKLWEAGEILLD
ncbi:MAG: ABC transporter substrate binding protein [Spirochaetales bacterium]|nr:ABC transporter substrate binding protein [Spirochaetales bacterium]